MQDVFFFTDLHGHLKMFHIMRDWCYKQNPNCTIIYGGDAADRGDFGYQIIKELLDDPHIVYLYGNHEDLFVKAADELIGHYACDDEHYNKLHSCKTEDEAKEIIIDNCGKFNVILHLQNGGCRTLIDWLLDGADEEIIDKLRNLSRVYQYKNIDFCHAGGGLHAFDDVCKALNNKESIPHYAESHIIWDRNSLPLGWKTGRICVFGHTPSFNLPNGIYGRDKSMANVHPCAWQDHMGAKDKRGGWKIDMDTGVIWSNRGFVLNCNSLELQGFELKNEEIHLLNYNMEINI